MPTMKRVFTSLFAVALLACGGDSSTAATASIAGTWNLYTRNGTAVTFTFSDGSVENAAWSGNTITSTVQGGTFVFTR